MTILCAALVSGAALSAQEKADTVSTSRMYRKHYRADIELSWTNPNIWGITSSHGYSFGNGLYVGGGVGFTF